MNNDKTPLTAEAMLDKTDSLSMVVGFERFYEKTEVLTVIQEYAAQQTASLQERVVELEKQLADHKIANFWEHFQAEHKEKIEAEQHAEKLMGLLKKQIAVCSCAICWDHWHSYKKEHGLTE